MLTCINLIKYAQRQATNPNNDASHLDLYLRQLLFRAAARQLTANTNSSSPDGSGTAATAFRAATSAHHVPGESEWEIYMPIQVAYTLNLCSKMQDGPPRPGL